ncbi:MAG: hypothetical protein IT548_07985 [Alphaproteobacteria bacterium]|nr:hypothetical protein [Alphaproteobacteria bacterium]
MKTEPDPKAKIEAAQRDGWREACFAFGVCGLLAGAGLALTGHDGTAGLIAGLCLLVLTVPGRGTHA